jgi:hypothetical protein
MMSCVGVYAGPPFFTDDPVPVEYHHWEINFASQYSRTADGRSAALPLVDANYGARPDLHLHLLVSGVYNDSESGPAFYGIGDIETGFKYRFIHESDTIPQVAMYPAVDWPTGDENRGLGSGRTQVFLPLWLQKSWGPWSTFGGGGYWLRPGRDRKNWAYAGWAVQRDLSKKLTLGAEIFHRTPDAIDTTNATGFTVGAQLNLNDHYRLLIASGEDISGPDHFTQYLALQWSFGRLENE